MAQDARANGLTRPSLARVLSGRTKESRRARHEAGSNGRCRGGSRPLLLRAPVRSRRSLPRARTPAGSRHEPRRQENTDHRKGEADFYDGADEKTDPGGNPSAAGATDVAVGGQLAEYGADERSDDQAR